MEGETTISVGGVNATASDPPVRLALTVAAHPNPEFVGIKHVLEQGAPMTIGRGGRQFGLGVLDDRGLSRQHVTLATTRDGVRLEDRGSRNGTFVNGEPVAKADVVPGDAIQMGNIVLLLHFTQRLLVEPKDESLVASSVAMLHAVRSAHRAATQPTATLIQGPPGVGKELIAREVHRASQSSGAFVPVNCAALADTLVLSELFGHTQGAFSGATSQRAGLVEEAAGGTLFLDEIADATPALQAALLRLLEQGEYRRVGEEQLRRSQARVVTATHVSLDVAVQEGRFRPDLHSRIARYVIDVPPLSERPVDIVALSRAIVGENERAMTPELMVALLRYPWPANVRELQSVLHQAMTNDPGAGPLRLAPDVAARLARRESTRPATTPTRSKPKPARDEVVAAIRAHDGNLRSAARALGVGRASLYRWLDRWGISPSSLRSDDERGEPS